MASKVYFGQTYRYWPCQKDAGRIDLADVVGKMVVVQKTHWEVRPNKTGVARIKFVEVPGVVRDVRVESLHKDCRIEVRRRRAEE